MRCRRLRVTKNIALGATRRRSINSATAWALTKPGGSETRHGLDAAATRQARSAESNWSRSRFFRPPVPLTLGNEVRRNLLAAPCSARDSPAVCLCSLRTIARSLRTFSFGRDHHKLW